VTAPDTAAALGSLTGDDLPELDRTLLVGLRAAAGAVNAAAPSSDSTVSVPEGEAKADEPALIRAALEALSSSRSLLEGSP